MLNDMKGRGQGGINKEKKEDSVGKEQGKVSGKGLYNWNLQKTLRERMGRKGRVGKT